MALPPSYQVAVEQKKMQQEIFVKKPFPTPTGSSKQQTLIKGADSTPVNFTINGQQYTVSPQDVASNYPLLSFIREQTGARGVKRSCGEGGCGACGVAYTYTDPATGASVTRTINSCLRPILACDGAAITTNDGLAADPSQTAAHKIQSTLAEKNGSQCGFCSNGMVMTMYGLLARNPNPTALEIEQEFDGNLCRCTGYRPIMEAMKTFAASGKDIKDFEMPSCVKTGCSNRHVKVEIEDAVAHVDHHDHKKHAAGVVKIHDNSTKKALTGSSSSSDEESNIEKLKLVRPRPLTRRSAALQQQQQQQQQQKENPMEKVAATVNSGALKATDGVDWVECSTIADLNNYLSWYTSLSKKVILAVAQTSQAVIPQTGAVKLFIANIPQLNVLTQNGSGIQIGAAVTVQDAMEYMKTVQPVVPGGNRHFPQAVLHLGRLASHLIRNIASLVGNLFLTKHAATENKNFQSDAMVVLFGLGATLSCFNAVQNSSFTINTLADFFNYDFTGCYVQTINIPWCTNANETFMTYKVAKRRVNAHAFVNAAFRAVVDPSTKKITGNPSVFFGGVFSRDQEVSALEMVLAGLDVTSTTAVQAALTSAKSILVPDQAFNNYSAEQVAYIQNVAVAYVYKFILSITPQCPAPLLNAAKCWITRSGPTTSSQNYGPSDPAEAPVNIPMTKMHAIEQTSGTAEYTEDLPAAGPDTLYCYAVLSPVSNCTLIGVDYSAAQMINGYVTYIDASTLTTLNVVNSWAAGTVLIPNGQTIPYAGSPVALVLATSKFAAEQAAKVCVVNTSKPTSAPIVSLAQAISSTQPIAPPPGSPPMSVSKGNAAAVLATAKNKYSGTASVGWQYHFHLEGHVTNVIPRGGRYEVFSATQMPVANQGCVAAVLGVPQSAVILDQRRCGGGYGGKIVNAQFGAIAAAIGVKLTKKPVYFTQFLSDYMKSSGFRAARQMEYEVSWNDDGTITAFNANIYCGCGSSPEGEIGAAFVTLQSLDNCYNIPNFNAEAKLMLLNLPAVNACRGPGWVPAVQLMESVISMVSTQSGLPRDTIRAKNFYPKSGGITPGGMNLPYNTIPELWTDINNNADIAARRAQIQTFNNNNYFFKKGLALVPVRFGVGLSGNNFDSQVCVYPDGTVAISHGGSEIGQGLNVKVAQVAAYKLGMTQQELLNNVQVLTTNTRCISSNSNVTGGSVSSELCGLSIMHACEQINQRIAPFRQKGMSFTQVAQAAANAGVHLTASGYTYAPPATSAFNYNSYGVAAVEAEMDCLTGEYQMTRVDLLFDAGKSLNPMIDVGQIEGGFMFGCGYHVFEDIDFDPITGAPKNASTWEYKPASAYDTPIVWNTTLLPNAPNPLGIMSSKATGEPGVCLGSAFVQAIESCVEAQLQQTKGSSARFSVQSTPFSVMQAQLACGIQISDMTV